MSRRNPVQDRAEQNRVTLKSLVKVESNKSCADCKRNKHPRWASWNLGIFVCIRCSGIHRGMGTHISKVKSVDLDSWTDEQLQNMLRWGNARANKYWEHKLAPGHMPSESKIENFIRTKYESKRWVMEGDMPDPSSLGADGDDVPLNVVQEKATIGSASSAKDSTASSVPTFRAPARPAPSIDLMGGDDGPQRPSAISRQPPQKAPAAPPKQTKPGDSLLGLDFFGGATAAAPEWPSSSTAAPAAAAPRADLKQSILSLYASTTQPAAPQQQHRHQPSESFGGFQSPTQGASGTGFNDAFSNLSFGASPPAQPAKADPFGSLSGGSSRRQPSASSFGGGGSFFDPPAQRSAPPQPVATQHTFSPSSGFGDLFSPTAQASAAPPKSPNRFGGDLFDLASPAAVPAPVSAPPAQPTSPAINSAFNLSSTRSAPQPKPQAAAPVSNFATSDPWGSSDVWGSSNTTSASAPPAPKPAPSIGLSNNFSGWGSTPAAKPTSPPQITQDDDFGGWSSAPATTATPAATSKPAAPSKTSGGGFSSNNDDLFSNVWE